MQLTQLLCTRLYLICLVVHLEMEPVRYNLQKAGSAKPRGFYTQPTLTLGMLSMFNC